jgi:hypothetical protein
MCCEKALAVGASALPRALRRQSWSKTPAFLLPRLTASQFPQPLPQHTQEDGARVNPAPLSFYGGDWALKF